MARIIMQPSGKSVDCAYGDTVLMALEKAGYALPNNCRAGACGECKVKVTAGQFDQGMVLDMALSQEERRQGYGLMCMAKPISDELTIEWGTEDARPKLFPPREDALFVVTDKRAVAERVVELRLRPVGQPIRYWPGQYVTLGNPRADIPPRAYSISNAPRPDGELVLQVARADDGQDFARFAMALAQARSHVTVALGDDRVIEIRAVGGKLAEAGSEDVALLELFDVVVGHFLVYE